MDAGRFLQLTALDPLTWGAIGLAGAAAASGFGWVWWKDRKRRGDAAEVLDEYKTDVVKISETLDRLQHRHKMLPFTDDDFTVPMVGRTLEEYETVQLSLDRYRERWLKLMDIWDNAQALVESEKIGRKEGFRKAEELIAESGVVKELEAIRDECSKPLDLLENAHERADEALGRVDDVSEELGADIAQIEGLELSTDPYQTRMDLVAELTDAGRTLRTPDPIAAEEKLREAVDRIEGLKADTAYVIEAEGRAGELNQKIDELRSRVERFRDAGYLFAEPDASPDYPLSEAESKLELVRSMLQMGDPAAIRGSLESGFALAKQADESLNLCEHMRTNCAAEVAKKKAELRRLLDEAATAELSLQELERNFDRESWLSVADNVVHANEMVETLDKLLDEATIAARDDTQHYQRASRILDEVTERQADVAAFADDIRQTLERLTALKLDCEQRLEQLALEAKTLDAELRRHTDDRTLCNHRFQQACSRLEETAHSTRKPVVNWSIVDNRLRYSDEDFSQVRHLLAEDLRLAQQARSEIGEAERTIRKTRTFYQSGVAPDVTRARMTVADAQRSLERQAYEEAVETANQAEQMARDAYDEAVLRMQERRRRIAAQRRAAAMRQMGSFLEAVTAAAAHAAVQSSRRRR